MGPKKPGNPRNGLQDQHFKSMLETSIPDGLNIFAIKLLDTILLVGDHRAKRGLCTQKLAPRSEF